MSSEAYEGYLSRGRGRGAPGRHRVADRTGDPDAMRRHIARTPVNGAPAVLASTAPERALAPRSAPPLPSPDTGGDVLVVFCIGNFCFVCSFLWPRGFGSIELLGRWGNVLREIGFCFIADEKKLPRIIICPTR